MEHSPVEGEQERIASLVEELGADYVTVRLSATMLQKSIIDAREAVQLLLKRAGVVDYGPMQQGRSEGGEERQAHLLTAAGARHAWVSFYRPQTKAGDPRFWPHGLKADASPGELLVVFATQRGLVLVIVSTSTQPSLELVSSVSAELGLPQRSLKKAALLLRDQFQGIQARGWIEAVGHGPRCVGETFELAMGLTTNSYSRPDFMGEIEIKASRVSKSKSRGRLQTLVALAPRWTDALRSSRDLVRDHGYYDHKKGRQALYCSIFTTSNSLGWRLDVDVARDTIFVSRHDVPVLQFSIADLSTALERKHPATIFVSARSRKAGGREAFHYFAARYCESLSAPKYIESLVAGNACLDFTAHIKENNRGRDHGYLWRIKGEYLEGIFAYRRDLVDPKDATQGSN